MAAVISATTTVIITSGTLIVPAMSAMPESILADTGTPTPPSLLQTSTTAAAVASTNLAEIFFSDAVSSFPPSIQFDTGTPTISPTAIPSPVLFSTDGQAITVSLPTSRFQGTITQVTLSTSASTRPPASTSIIAFDPNSASSIKPSKSSLALVLLAFAALLV